MEGLVSFSVPDTWHFLYQKSGRQIHKWQKLWVWMVVYMDGGMDAAKDFSYLGVVADLHHE